MNKPARGRGISRLLRALRKARRGGVAVIFALALLPIMAAVAAAVDYSRASAARASMQAALDAAALILSRDASGLTAAQLQSKAASYFDTQFKSAYAKNVTVASVLSTPQVGSYTLDLTASGRVVTTFAPILGMDEIAITATSQVAWGIKKLELALVLDVTGSMASQNRMVELKKATKSLLTTLKNAAGQPDDVKVAIVPFAGNVNVGSGNVNAAWLDWTDWEAEPTFVKPNNWSSIGPGSSCPFSTGTHGFGCTTGPANGAPNTNTIPSSGSYRGYICPSVDNGRQNPRLIGRYYNGCYTSTTYSCSGADCSCSGYANCSCSGWGNNRVCRQPSGYYEHAWLKNARSTFNGCVRDRAKDYDASDTTPTTVDATKFQPYQSSYCPPALLALGNDWTALNAKVDSFTSLGPTNITIGLAWGWHALTPNEPLTTAAAPRLNLDKVIVLMTDGNNTINRWDGTGYDPPGCSACDTRTALACTNLRAAGIKLYTVRLMEGNATLLRNCATTPGMYYDVAQASGLNETFATIAQNLANLRIAR